MISIDSKIILSHDSSIRKQKLIFFYVFIFVLAAIFSAMAFVSTSASFAASYYIAKNGNDSNPGTIDRPWGTITKANSILKAGDSVYIRQGTYNERIEPANSGHDGAPIVYENYNNEEVIVTGAGGKGASLVGIDYITIIGLTFDGQDKVPVGIYINNHGDHIIIKNCVIRNYRDAGNTWGHGIWADSGGVSYLVIEDCDIYRNGTSDPYIEMTCPQF